MTAICGGGTSSAKPGFGEFVYVAPAALGALLNNIPTPWAVALAGYIGRVTFELATFCPADPPAVPTFTAADVVALLNPYNPFTYSVAQAKFQDLIGAFLWDDLCRCDNGTVPASPTPPAEPTGMPSIDPPAIGTSYPTGGPCAVISGSDTAAASSGANRYGPLTPLPAGATYASVSGTFSAAAATAGNYIADIAWGTAGYAGYPGTNQFPVAGHIPYLNLDNMGVTSSGVVSIPSGATHYWTVFSHNTLAPVPISLDAAFNFFCGNPSTGGDVPQPCPADPFTIGLLEQILGLVTLIQRQAAPFAYIAGAAHAGLTGQGSFAVQGLLGARVEITDFGSNTGVEDGDPDALWNAGWVNWGNADGVSPRQYLTNAQMLTLPSLAGQYTEFHYSLGIGVTATVTELEREP